MRFVQKLAKAIMLPVACLPLCGIPMGLGYLLYPASMQGGEIAGVLPSVGLYLVKAGGALIDHIALLFAVGVGMADERDGTAVLAGLAAWLMLTTLLKARRGGADPDPGGARRGDRGPGSAPRGVGL